jgi:hypothetical protein
MINDVKPWMHLALYRIWRCGVPNTNELAIPLQEVGLPLDEIFKGLIGEGLVVLRMKQERTFVQLTDSGLKVVYADEEPKWRERLKGVVRTAESLTPHAKQAYELRSQDMTLIRISEIVKCSPSHTQAMIKRYEKVKAQHDHWNNEIQRFVAGELPFRDLRIDVLGEMSVRLANCLFRCEIHTVPQLLNTTSTHLLRMKNFGRQSIKEMGALLGRYDTKLESGGLDFRWGYAFNPV